MSIFTYKAASYADWVNEISARYPLENLEYSGERTVICKLVTDKNVLLIGSFSIEQNKGRCFDRRSPERTNEQVFI